MSGNRRLSVTSLQRSCPQHVKSTMLHAIFLAHLATMHARGWNFAQAVRRSLVEPAIIAAWFKRIEESGPDAPAARNTWPNRAVNRRRDQAWDACRKARRLGGSRRRPD